MFETNFILIFVSLRSYSVHRVSQEERLIFWEVRAEVILSKNVYMNMCPIPNVFRDGAIWMHNRKILIRKRYYVYVLFLIPVFIVQVTELAQGYNKFSKIPPSTSVHFACCSCVVRLSASWRSFMQAITSSMLTSSSSRVSTFSVHFWHYHRRSHKHILYQHISAFVKMRGIFHNTPTMPLSTVTTANWRFTQIHMIQMPLNLGNRSEWSVTFWLVPLF